MIGQNLSGTVFISYSRAQLNYAEALVTYLKRAGVHTWFDLQQLYPGCDWSTEINNGLSNCRALILIASETSLESPYVRLEWEEALKARKPVYVLAYDMVDLPAELNTASVINGYDYHQAFERLLTALQYRQEIKDKLSFNWFQRLSKLPHEIRSVLLAVIGSAFCLFSISGFVQNFGNTDTTNLLLLAVAIWQIFSAYRIFHHQASYQELLLDYGFAILIGIVTSVLIFFGFCGAISGNPYQIICFVASVGGLRAVIKGYMGLKFIDHEKHSQLLPWLPTGKSPQSLRRLAMGKFYDEAQTSPPASFIAAYTLCYDPVDSPMAKMIRQQFLPLKEQAQEKPEHRLDLLILSNFTSKHMIQEWWQQNSQNKACVLTSMVEIPEEFKAVERLQLIDLRDGNWKKLQYMIDWLMHFPNANMYFSVENTPRRFNLLVLPPAASFLATIFNVFGGICLGILLSAFIKSWYLFPEMSFVLAALGLVGLLLISSAYTLRIRVMSLPLALVVYLITTFLMIYSVYTMVDFATYDGDMVWLTTSGSLYVWIPTLWVMLRPVNKDSKRESTFDSISPWFPANLFGMSAKSRIAHLPAFITSLPYTLVSVLFGAWYGGTLPL